MLRTSVDRVDPDGIAEETAGGHMGIICYFRDGSLFEVGVLDSGGM